MNQKNIGNSTEKEFAKLMHGEGWWITILADKANGQPFDVIMSKNGVTWFLDVKHIQESSSFPLARIEENQRNSMRMLQECGTDRTGFAIKFDEEWYLLQYKDIDFNQKSISKTTMRKLVFKK